MRQTVYLDVLVAVNFLVDYFLLYAAGQLSASAISRVRLCLGALLGAACSCSILLPPLPLAVNALITAVSCGLMTLVAFGFRGWRRFGRAVLWVTAVTIGYGGLMLALWLFAAPRGLIVNNGAVYIDIPPGLLVLATVVCYALTSLFSGQLRKRNLMRSRCRVTIFNRGNQVSIDAIVDTGNLLTEPFSGLPVIVAERDALQPVLPEGCDSFGQGSTQSGCAPPGLRVIPYSGVGGQGVMLAFRPQRITTQLPGGRPQAAEAYIGVLNSGRVGREHQAIVNPDILL